MDSPLTGYYAEWATLIFVEKTFTNGIRSARFVKSFLPRNFPAIRYLIRLYERTVGPFILYDLPSHNFPVSSCHRTRRQQPVESAIVQYCLFKFLLSFVLTATGGSMVVILAIVFTDWFVQQFFQHVVLAGLSSFAVAWFLFVQQFLQHVVLAGVRCSLASLVVADSDSSLSCVTCNSA